MTGFISLRPICPEDEPFLRRVYTSTRQEELAVVPWTAEQKEAFLRMQFDAQHRYYQEHYASADFLLVLSNDVPIGRLYLDRWETEFRIIDIALLPEHRGVGIGSRLLKDVLDEADRAGKAVSIHVEKFNPALRLYERLGFLPVADTGVYLRMERPPIIVPLLAGHC